MDFVSAQQFLQNVQPSLSKLRKPPVRLCSNVRYILESNKSRDTLEPWELFVAPSILPKTKLILFKGIKMFTGMNGRSGLT